uniref:Uncharacterized protein n=1 Tax=Kalanchoe fedtschenkoi TaxID=63787 RepID=A0A7N0ZZE3_KALFE
MVSMPNRLEHMTTVIRSINPHTVVMIEIKANHNYAPSFGNRFAEALFYYNALFDCMETYQKCYEPDRITAESIYCSQAIRNIVAAEAEAEARTTQRVKISAWRAFFSRFGLSESQISALSLYQATLVLKEYSCGSSVISSWMEKALLLGGREYPCFFFLLGHLPEHAYPTSLPDKTFECRTSADCHKDEGGGIWGQNEFDEPEACQKPGFVFGSIRDESSDLGNHREEMRKVVLTDQQQRAQVPSSFASLPVQYYLKDRGKMRWTPGENSNNVEKGDTATFIYQAADIPELYRSPLQQSHREIVSQSSTDSMCPKTDNKSLTAEEIFKVAGKKFILSSSIEGLEGDPSRFSNQTDIHYSGFSEEQINDVELAGSLFSAAESVVLEQLARATRLLDNCDLLSSCTGSTVQRVVHYFSEALREKIDRQSGRLSMKGLSKLRNIHIEEACVIPHPVFLSCYHRIPFTQPPHFAGMQAIMENVADSKKVHVIDFRVTYGVCWTILIQALASRDASPLEYLKLTAVRTNSNSDIEDAGKRLSDFAQCLGIPFAFRVVMVDDMLNLSEDLFELEDDEAVAVYAPYLLRTMLCIPDRLDHMMRVISCINPCIMVMIEVEANTNAPCFGKRFTEALFYYSAFFDCLATSMESSDPERIFLESSHCGQDIRNILTTEGEARTTRHVKLSIWRTFFARFGYTETKLSRSSLY